MHVSICQGKPFWGFPIFDPQPDNESQPHDRKSLMKALVKGAIEPREHPIRIQPDAAYMPRLIITPLPNNAGLLTKTPACSSTKKPTWPPACAQWVDSRFGHSTMRGCGSGGSEGRLDGSLPREAPQRGARNPPENREAMSEVANAEEEARDFVAQKAKGWGLLQEPDATRTKPQAPEFSHFLKHSCQPICRKKKRKGSSTLPCGPDLPGQQPPRFAPGNPRRKGRWYPGCKLDPLWAC